MDLQALLDAVPEDEKELIELLQVIISTKLVQFDDEKPPEHLTLELSFLKNQVKAAQPLSVEILDYLVEFFSLADWDISYTRLPEGNGAITIWP